MSIRIALAGNPNCGKTTLFNALTGSNQFVGNWPGVTVEKKEGNLKQHDDVIITDLPGIYSLSPYTPEEVVAREYLIGERPDAILNIIDGTNLERNLYLTTQLTEIGIPVVCAVNMMDVVTKKGDKINLNELSKALGCQMTAISALKGEGIIEAAEIAIEAVKNKTKTVPKHNFSGPVEHAIAHIEEAAIHDMPEEQQRWYAIKIFERDIKVLEQLGIPKKKLEHIENDIKMVELEMDDDAEAIITNERYNYITSIIGKCLKRKNKSGVSTSDKIDKVVTSRLLGLPVFALVMFLVYYVSMITVGAAANKWADEGLFGEGWHLFGIGSSQYDEACEEYGKAKLIVNGYEAYVEENGSAPSGNFIYSVNDESDFSSESAVASLEDYAESVISLEKYSEEPSPDDYGIWIPGIPVLIEKLLGSDCPKWLHGLVIDGIVAGVGSVLGFVPQMMVLFFMLGFIESCGYMSRVAFILDRVFRKFGLSGKSFIPILIGTGCGVPGIMASRTIENESDRRMTIMTTTFIPCGAKTPFIAMIAGAIFGGSPWIAVSAYFIGMASIIVSGIILKKTKMFAGEPAPFVMELPEYHLPTLKNLLHSMWERGWEFIKKAATIILLCTIIVWFLTYFGTVNGKFGMLEQSELEHSVLATIGKGIAWIFAPIGWGRWQAAVASLTGIVAKENIVGTLSVLYGSGEGSVYSVLSTVFSKAAGLSMLTFNLLCAPCLSAIAAIKREMNSGKWTAFAIGYQCVFAYIVSFVIYRLGLLFEGNFSVSVVVGAIAAVLILVFGVYLVVKPEKKHSKASKR